MSEPPTIEGPPAAPPRTMAEMVERAPSREILVRPRTLLVIAGTVLGVALAVWVFLEAWQVISWVFIALLFAIAMMPAVDFLERRGLSNTLAVSLVCFGVLGVVGLIAWAVVPTLVDQTTELIQAVPGAIDDITKGRGPLGFLQTDYGLADQVRDAAREPVGQRDPGLQRPRDRDPEGHPHRRRRHRDDLLHHLLHAPRGAPLGGLDARPGAAGVAAAVGAGVRGRHPDDPRLRDRQPADQRDRRDRRRTSR